MVSVYSYMYLIVNIQIIVLDLTFISGDSGGVSVDKASIGVAWHLLHCLGTIVHSTAQLLVQGLYYKGIMM